MVLDKGDSAFPASQCREGYFYADLSGGEIHEI